MVATVISVVTGLTGQSSGGKSYDYTDFTYKPDPYKGQEKNPVTRKVFTNLPVHDNLLQLTAGDRVELEFETNGQYKNLVGITKLADQAAPAPPQQSAPPSSKPAGKGKGGGSSTFLTFDQRKELDAKKDRTICKQVALKAAVELKVAVLKKGEEVDTNAVITLAGDLATFLTEDDQRSGDADKEEDSKSTGQASGPPAHGDDDIPF